MQQNQPPSVVIVDLEASGGALQDYQVCPSSLWADPAGPWQKNGLILNPGTAHHRWSARVPMTSEWNLCGTVGLCVGAVGTRDDGPDLQLTQRRPIILYSTLAHTRSGSRGCINMGTSWYFWHISKSCRDAVRIDPLRSFKRHDLFMKWQTYLCKLFPGSLLSKSFVTTAGYKGLESYTIRIHLPSPYLIIHNFLVREWSKVSIY